MGKLIVLSEEIKDEIIRLYLSGIGSTTISKDLNIDKRKILNLLKERDIKRNRFHSDEFYSNFWFEDNLWWGYWKCNTCKQDIKFSVNKKSLLNRSVKRKKTCKQCSLDKQVGEGNPFYGKTHSEESISRMLISQHKTLKPISKDEKEIFKILEDNGYNVKQQEIIGKPFDFYLPEYNLLIEYNGDYWHCNPIEYNSDYFNKKKKKTAKEIWEYDKNKLDLAKQQGYICEVIWESDYKKNKKIVLETIEKYGKK